MQHLQKTGGGVSNFPARLPLSRRLPRLAFRPIPIPYPLSPFLSYSCRALLHNGTSTTHFYSIGYTHFPSRRRVYPIEASWLSPRKATGRAVHSARFLTSLPPYFLTSRGAHRAPLATLSPHGTATPRPALPGKRPMARRDRARHSRFA